MVPGSWFGGLEASLAVAAPMALGSRSHKPCLHHQAEMALCPNHWLLRLGHVRHLQRLHLQQLPQLLHCLLQVAMPSVMAFCHGTSSICGALQACLA